MKPEDARRIVDAASEKHALTRGGSFYVAGFLDAFTNVYPQKRWEKILQERFFLPDESRFNDKAFYQSARELSVANHIYCEHVSDFAVDKRVKPRASYRQSFRLDYGNLEEQLSDGKIANVSLPEIKTAIEQLSFEERAELAAWLHGWNDDEWDEQMKRDIGSGKLDDVLHEVEEDIRSGRTREMP